MKKYFKGNYGVGLMTITNDGIVIVRKTNKYFDGSGENTGVSQVYVPGMFRDDLGEFLMLGEKFYDPEAEMRARLEAEKLAAEHERMRREASGDFGIAGVR